MFALYKKELRSHFLSPFAYTITALFMMLFSISYINGISDLVGTYYRFSFAAMLYDNFFYFIFLIPALTMRTFADERKSRTEVLLMTSPLNVFQIVIAKFLAVATVFFSMVLLTGIFPVITKMTGDIIWSSLICGYIGFFLWGLVCIAIGMLMSSFTDSPIIAAILGEGSMIILLFIDYIKNSGLFASFPGVVRAIGAFSTSDRFMNFSNGLFGIDDLVFFISAIVMFVGFTIISIEKRRWSRG